MMTATEFSAALERMFLSPVQFAHQVDVTSRAVNLWAAGDRPVPGPVEAYIRLLERTPKSLRDLEREHSQK